MTAKPDRWQKAAERTTARAKKVAGPLFAPLVKPADPVAVQTRAERMIAEQMATIARGHAELEARGQIDRATVAAHVTPEELARLDKLRSWCPASGEYTADFWGGECRKRGLPWVGQAAHEALFAGVNAGVAAVRAREAAAERASGEQLDLPSGYRVEPGEEPSRLRLAMMLGATAEEHAAEEAAEHEAAAVPRKGRVG